MKKHAKLWVSFWENIEKLLGGKLSIEKMNVQVRNQFGQRRYKIFDDFVVFKNVICLAESWVSFHHRNCKFSSFCGIIGHPCKKMREIMGPIFEPKWHVPVQKSALATQPFPPWWEY